MTLYEIATIWSDGTRFTADDLVRAYRSYEAECEERGIDADDAETFFERDMEIPNVDTTDENTILAEANSEQRDRFDRAASAAGHASGTSAANDCHLWGKTVAKAIAFMGDDQAVVEVTRYAQDGTVYVCSGNAATAAGDARTAAEGALRRGERLADDMERVDGCCTWTVIAEDA